MVRITERIGRVELLQWAGVVLAPLAWVALHMFGVLLTLAACGPANARWGLSLQTITTVATVLAALVAAAGFASAIAARVLVDADDDQDPPPAGRIFFMAVCGITTSGLLLAIILMAGAGVSLGDACHQS
jgi:hypothetical protein